MPVRLAYGTGALLLLALFAFWPRYLGRPRAQVDVYTHLHAVAGTLWLLALMVQALLIRRGARSQHRSLGWFAVGIGALFVVSGILLAHFRFSHMRPETFAEEAYTLMLPLVVNTEFALAWGLAVAMRRNTALHSRYMASSAALLIDPVFARILAIYLPPLPALELYQALTYALTDTVLLLLAATLPRGSRERRQFLGFVAAAACLQLCWFTLAKTEPFLAMASAFRRLPLT